MNVVTLIGNLATEVELREIGPDKKVASFVLAVDRASRGGGADFVSVSAWDRQAELCAEYLGKGRRIAVDGRLKSRSWEEEASGEARSRWLRVGSSSSAAARVVKTGRRWRGGDPVPGAGGRRLGQRADEVLDRGEAGVRPLADQEVAAAGDRA